MQFPILILKNSDAALYVFEKWNFGLVSKGGESFYKSGKVFDSTGKTFRILRISERSKAPFIVSVKYFQPMYKVSVVTEFEETISLPKLREIILDHVNSRRRYFESLGSFEDIEQMVFQKTTFVGLISVFK